MFGIILQCAPALGPIFVVGLYAREAGITESGMLHFSRVGRFGAGACALLVWPLHSVVAMVLRLA